MKKKRKVKRKVKRKNKDEIITGKRALVMIDKNAYLREPKNAHEFNRTYWGKQIWGMK